MTAVAAPQAQSRFGAPLTGLDRLALIQAVHIAHAETCTPCQQSKPCFDGEQARRKFLKVSAAYFAKHTPG